VNTLKYRKVMARWRYIICRGALRTVTMRIDPIDSAIFTSRYALWCKRLGLGNSLKTLKEIFYIALFLSFMQHIYCLNHYKVYMKHQYSAQPLVTSYTLAYLL